MRKIFCLLLVFVSPCLKVSASDSDEVYLDSVVSISEVNVVARQQREIIRPQMLKGEDLEKLNSYSVADALRYFSGVQIKDYGGIGGIKTVNIRGMGTNHVGVFYNGIQLGNAQNGQVDLSRYSLENVEMVSLYNGQKSDIFQTAKDFSSSSAVYISTKRPVFAGNEKSHFKVAMKTGSFGLVNPSVFWDQKLSDNLHLSANAEWTHANGRYKFRYRRLQLDGAVAYDTTAVRQNGDVESLRTEVGLYGYMPGGKWNLNGYFYASERGIPGAIVNNVFRHGERQWDKSAFGQGTLELDVSGIYSFKINGKFAWDYSNFLRDDPKELYLNNRYYQKEAYLSVANLFRVTDWWSVSAALDGQLNQMDADLVDFAYPTRWTELVSVATAFELKRLSIQAALLGTFIQESVRSKKLYTASDNRRELSPSFFFSYKPVDRQNLSINGFFKKIFRMPTFNDLYYTEIGNSNLKPEFTYQYDLGITYAKEFSHPFFDFLNLKADGYYNAVTNKIIAYPTGQQFRWTMINLGKVRIIGAEVSGDIGFYIGKVNMKTHLQYTYQSARDYTDPDDSFYGDQIPYIPWHSGSVSYTANWKGWDFNYSFIYTGERYNEQENIRFNYEQPWYTHDMSLSKTFSVRKWQFRVTGELLNVFNQSFEVIHNYPMPGRNFKISLRVML